MKTFIINFLRAFNIPLSFFPFLYSSVLKKDRFFYRPFFQPWLTDKKLKNILRRIKNNTTSRKETFYYLKELSNSVKNIDGIFCECGVYQGGTANLLGDIAKTQGKHLHLFDTFSGMPEQTISKDYFKIGSFSDTSLDSVKKNLKHLKNIFFHKGFLPDTLKSIESKKISFAHIDVDQFLTTKKCLNIILKQMTKGGIIVIDDYGRPGTPGARSAVEEVCKVNQLFPISLPTGQCFILIN